MIPFFGYSDGQWCSKNVQKNQKNCFSENGNPKFVGYICPIILHWAFNNRQAYMMFTDRISEWGNAIAFVWRSVCPSDCFHSIFWTDWPLTLNFCMWAGHDHSSQGIEGQCNTVGQAQGQGHGLDFIMRSVWPRSRVACFRLRTQTVLPNVSHFHSKVRPV